jgi:ribosomal protein S18 acetylase RimI-like enzyme
MGGLMEHEVVVERLTPDGWRRWREVRRAALAEAPEAFGATLAEWSGAGDVEARWRQRLTDVPCNVVALVDGEPVGQASGCTIEEDSDGGCEVISVWVAPDQRGTGVVAAVLGAVETWAVAEGATALTLSVKRHNGRAIAAYERLGFRRTGEAGHDPSEERMVKRLPEVQGRHDVVGE